MRTFNMVIANIKINSFGAESYIEVDLDYLNRQYPVLKAVVDMESWTYSFVAFDKLDPGTLSHNIQQLSAFFGMNAEQLYRQLVAAAKTVVSRAVFSVKKDTSCYIEIKIE